LRNNPKEEELASDEINQNQEPIPEVNEAKDEESLHLIELKSLVRDKDRALAKANARISELEQVLVESEEKLKTTNDSLAEAIVSYKKLVIENSPEVPEELIGGESVPAVNQSLEQARSLVSRVKQGLEAEIQATRVPAGAPQRTSPDLSALSPREKIQYGVRR